MRRDVALLSWSWLASHARVSAGVAGIPAALLLAAFAFFHGLDAYPLRDNNEGLYAEIAREMWLSGDYVVPRLNGVPYLEKPPLLYWLTAGAYALFGPTTFAARLVPAASGFLLALLLIAFGRRVGDLRLGVFASLMLSGSLLFVLLSRTVLFDSLLTLLLSAALLNVFLWRAGHGRRHLLLAYGLIGLATLAKGFVAPALGGLISLLYLFSQPERRAWMGRFFDPAGVGLYLALTVPWHVAAAARQEDFAWFYLINEHVMRFLGRREPPDYHTGPAYYYLLRLPLLVLPWTPLLLLLRPGGTRVPSTAPLRRFLALWAMVPLIFFSLSRAKADYYCMPMVPPLALLFALALDRRPALPLLRFTAGALLALAGAAVLKFSSASGLALLERHQVPIELGPRIIVYATVLAFPAAAALLLSRKAAHTVLALAAASVPLTLFALDLAKSTADRTSSAEIADAIRSEGAGGRAIFVYRDYEDVFSSLRFYVDRPIYLIDSASRDLRFGCSHARTGSPCLSIEQFEAAARSAPFYVLVSADRLAEFQSRTRLQLDGRRFGRKWLLSSPAPLPAPDQAR